MRIPDKLFATLSVLLVAATSSHESFEVVKADSSGQILSVVVVLTAVTSLTFIAVLLSCGMRKPLF